MDFGWIVGAVVKPLVTAVVGLTATVAAPLLTKMGIAYARRRWHLDIDAREQEKLEQLATESIYAAEAAFTGPGNSQAKMAKALEELTSRATQAGIVIGEDAARAKLEKVLGEHGFTGPAAGALLVQGTSEQTS